jgi:hypothetical protein
MELQPIDFRKKLRRGRRDDYLRETAEQNLIHRTGMFVYLRRLWTANTNLFGAKKLPSKFFIAAIIGSVTLITLLLTHTNPLRVAIDRRSTFDGDKSCPYPLNGPALDEYGLLDSNSFLELSVNQMRLLEPRGGNTGCAHGGDYSFLVRKGERALSAVVVEFMGGGACWDKKSCKTYQGNDWTDLSFLFDTFTFTTKRGKEITLPQYDCMKWQEDVHSKQSSTGGGGVMDPFQAHNPVSNYSYVFIP